MARSLRERIFRKLHGTLDDGLVILTGSWAIGATGAVGAKTAGVGLTLARSDVGTYTVQATAEGAAASVYAFPFADMVVMTSDADPTNDTAAIDARPLSAVGSTGLVTFQTFDEAGVVRDPASGASVKVFILAKVSAI